MKFKFILFVYATLLSWQVAAGPRLMDIVLALPADGGRVQEACENAFQQALADREEYENRPGINLKCAFNINGKVMAQLRGDFVSRCASLLRDVDGERRGSNRVVPESKLSAMFADSYGVIFRRDCLDAAVSSFNGRRASQASYSIRTGTPAQREGCYAFHNCR